MSNEGFFSSVELKKCIPLPPRPQVKFPLPEPKKEVKASPVDQHSILFMDIECYINYFLVKFLRLSDGKFYSFERTEHQELDYDGIEQLLDDYEIVTFNGVKFDIPMLRLSLEGATCNELKRAANSLIVGGLTPYNFAKEYELPDFEVSHIDLIELLPGIVSLKIYGGRLHCEKMQDLPIEENATLTDSDMDDIDLYCGNDLDVTKLIYKKLLPQIELRRSMSKRYKLDLLSKSDAQIAEEVLKSEITKTKGVKLERPEVVSGTFNYKAPHFINFTNPKLNAALKIVETEPFTIGSNGRITMPEELRKLKINIGRSTYQMGMGGLHSTEKKAFHISDDKFSIYDWDVASYYPAIILGCGLYPKNVGKEFLQVYRDIVNERLNAKRSGDKIKADSLKITINGTFGKLASPYSVLYAPELMVQVTVTGQLALLMLIDMMESRGFSVVSANTDGIVIKCPKGEERKMHSVINLWSKTTGFEMESAQYAGLYSRDVNNYIAIKTDGEVKYKGCFAPAGIAKNPENEICTIALVEYLKYGIPFEKTIRNCADITKFITVRSVNGGAVKNGQYLGKAIRWYHNIDSTVEKVTSRITGDAVGIRYKTNGNLVPMTEGVRPIMDLSVPFPQDVDYDWYIGKCRELF